MTHGGGDRIKKETEAANVNISLTWLIDNKILSLRHLRFHLPTVLMIVSAGWVVIL
jgi:hypothetical protein